MKNYGSRAIKRFHHQKIDNRINTQTTNMTTGPATFIALLESRSPSFITVVRISATFLLFLCFVSQSPSTSPRLSRLYKMSSRRLLSTSSLGLRSTRKSMDNSSLQTGQALLFSNQAARWSLWNGFVHLGHLSMELSSCTGRKQMLHRSIGKNQISNLLILPI